MNNQVILYDRMSDTVKLIDGIKTISHQKAQHLGFTPAYLMQLACELLSLDKDPESKNALKDVQAAFKNCPKSKWDHIHNIVSYDRMSDKVKIFGGAITVPFRIAIHKGITPAHMVHMACQLLSLNHDQAFKSALPSAEKAEEACRQAQTNSPKYKNKRYK